MYYTIITKSGWQSDTTWRLGATFGTKAEAEAHSKKSADPRDNNYNVKIVAHRRPVKATGPASYKVGSYTAYAD